MAGRGRRSSRGHAGYALRMPIGDGWDSPLDPLADRAPYPALTELAHGGKDLLLRGLVSSDELRYALPRLATVLADLAEVLRRAGTETGARGSELIEIADALAAAADDLRAIK